MRLAIVGDTQNGTACWNATTAWDHVEASFQWIAAQTDIDFVLQTGDIVDKFALSGGSDCFCLGTDPAPGACADIDHPIFGTGNCTSCNDAEAIACAGGTTGLYCEWTRARALADMLEAASIPYFFLDGNHDSDIEDSVIPAGTRAPWTAYKLYFGRDNLSPHTNTSGTKILDNTGVDLPAAVWQTFTAAGIEWLHIALPSHLWWRPLVNGSVDNKAELLVWVKDVLDDHLGMPTIISSHHMMAWDGNGPSTLDCGLCEDDDGNVTITGHWVMNELAEDYPQIVVLISGHDRGMNHVVVTADTGHDVLGVLVDTSFGADDVDPSSWIYSSVSPFPGDSGEPGVLNGGGGLVHTLNIDPVRGQIWLSNWSDEEGGRDERLGQYGSRWSVRMPMCTDDPRFDLPAAACPELTASPRCCN